MCHQHISLHFEAHTYHTGSRSLTARDRNAIIRKSPAFTRQMEFEGGLRPPTSTEEHGTRAAVQSHSQPVQGTQSAVDDSSAGKKKPKAPATSQASQSNSQSSDFFIENDHLEMRLRIAQGNFVCCAVQANVAI
jgi:hypothetical protein